MAHGGDGFQGNVVRWSHLLGMSRRMLKREGRCAHYATPFAAARQGTGSPATTGSLLEIALSTKYAGIVRATALDLLRRYVTSEIADQVADLLRDRDPLVRAAAIPLQRAALPTTSASTKLSNRR